jgi:hypothetical protein
MSLRGWAALLAVMILGLVLAAPHLKNSYLGRLLGECSAGVGLPDCPALPPHSPRGGAFQN